MLRIGQTIGLVGRAIDLENLNIKKNFGVQTVIGQDDLFRGDDLAENPFAA